MPKKPPEETQAEKFKRLAREIGADENEAVFKERLKRIAKQTTGKPTGKDAPSEGRRGQPKQR